LTARVGLIDRVDFRVGSELGLPFPDASFDCAWSQNVAMNIADRPRYYAEMHRVLCPGGRLGGAIVLESAAAYACKLHSLVCHNFVVPKHHSWYGARHSG
jgi:ubiquinone/menaquinone biosynthesis C-methylase UbiE